KEYNRSLAALKKFKRVSKNSYSYTTGFASWVGFRTNTTIIVKNGVVIERKYIFDHPRQNKFITWNENKSNLNSHQNSGAAEPITLDTIYKRCKDDLLVDNEEKIYDFKTDKNGLISICGYTDKRCADDCFRGITINIIKKQ
ncbi:unnamed protein product, partial [Didymodactylos carnosus]